MSPETDKSSRNSLYCFPQSKYVFQSGLGTVLRYPTSGYPRGPGGFGGFLGLLRKRTKTTAPRHIAPARTANVSMFRLRQRRGGGVDSRVRPHGVRHGGSKERVRGPSELQANQTKIPVSRRYPSARRSSNIAAIFGRIPASETSQRACG